MPATCRQMNRTVSLPYASSKNFCAQENTDDGSDLRKSRNCAAQSLEAAGAAGE